MKAAHSRINMRTKPMPLKKQPRQQEEEEEDRKRRRAAPDEKEEELNRLCNEAMDRLEEEAELDRLCNEAMDRFEDEQRGDGFQFDLYPHSDKRAKKIGVHRRVFTSRLRPPRDLANLPRAHIPQLIKRALQQAIAMQILDGHEQDNDILMIKPIKARVSIPSRHGRRMDQPRAQRPTAVRKDYANPQFQRAISSG